MLWHDGLRYLPLLCPLSVLYDLRPLSCITSFFYVYKPIPSNFPMSSLSPFGNDLMSTTRLLYRYTELVCARHTGTIGEIHDLRVADLIKASQAVQSSLRGLKKHFPAKLRPNFDSIDTMASSLHKSFTAALHYKRPYSSNNPCGISFDYKYIESNKVPGEFKNGILALTKMVSMGMLLVHHFVLEFTMFMCALSDVMFEEQVMSIKDKTTFASMMRELNEYMTLGQNSITTLLGTIAGVPDALRDGANTFTVMAIADVRRTMDDLQTAFNGCANSTALLTMRLIYYSFILESLARYNNVNDDENRAFVLGTDNCDHYFMKQAALNLFETRRYFEDGNYRQTLLEQFMGLTDDPVYHYATLPFAGPDNDNQMVMQNVGGNVQIVPRVRVHVWRKKATWDNTNSWKQFALVHGEAAFMQDLMYNMVPLILGNQFYRNQENLHPQYLHMMLTRFYGPVDHNIFFVMEPNSRKSFVEAVNHTKNTLSSIRDPKIPNASSIQPMPPSLKTWVHEVFAGFHGDSKFKYIPSNAVVHRPTSINLNDVVRNRNVDVKVTNVVMNQSILPSECWNWNSRYAFNSLFLFHYGQFLSSIPTLQEQRAIGSESLVVTHANYQRYHTVPSWAENRPLTYVTTRALQAKIKEIMEILLDKFKNRPAPFLDPRSWITVAESNRADVWEKCEESYDLVKGTFISFNPLVGPVPAAGADVDRHVANGLEHIRNQNDVVRDWPGGGGNYDLQRHDITA